MKLRRLPHSKFFFVANIIGHKIGIWRGKKPKDHFLGLGEAQSLLELVSALAVEKKIQRET